MRLLIFDVYVYIEKNEENCILVKKIENNNTYFYQKFKTLIYYN